VNALLAGGALLLLLVGFVLGAAVTNDRSPGPARPPPTQALPAPSAPPSTTVRPAPPPQACLDAMERADQVISYLIGKIRDQRLSKSLQEFVESRRACQQAASR
jgi:hypothetical protein